MNPYCRLEKGFQKNVNENFKNNVVDEQIKNPAVHILHDFKVVSL